MNKVQWDKRTDKDLKGFDGEDGPNKKGSYTAGESISLSYKGKMIRLQITSVLDDSTVVAGIVDLQDPEIPPDFTEPDTYHGRSDLPPGLSYDEQYVIDIELIFNRMKEA
jgi:hypothetical protein